MVRFGWLFVVGCVAALLTAGPASAGPILDWFFPDDTPAPAYSPLRYWAPAAGRAYDNHHGPKVSVHAPDRHPEIAPTCTILTFPCPAVAPAATLIRPPTAPPESRFRY